MAQVWLRVADNLTTKTPKWLAEQK